MAWIALQQMDAVWKDARCSSRYRSNQGRGHLLPAFLPSFNLHGWKPGKRTFLLNWNLLMTTCLKLVNLFYIFLSIYFTLWLESNPNDDIGLRTEFDGIPGFSNNSDKTPMRRRFCGVTAQSLAREVLLVERQSKASVTHPLPLITLASMTLRALSFSSEKFGILQQI